MQSEATMDNIIDTKEVALRIKDIRETLELNQNEFAKSLGISASNLSLIERGSHLPGSDVLIALLAKFQVNFDYLHTGIGKMFRDKKEEAMFSGLTDDLHMKAEDIEDFFYLFRRSRYFQFYINMQASALSTSPDFKAVEEEVRRYNSQKGEEQEKDVNGQ